MTLTHEMPRIGCAGWAINASHRELFGPGESVLERYATLFDAVEINSSFYRSHRVQTYARWAATVPEDFRFSVKMPREITHISSLRLTDSLLEQFLEEISALGLKLGGVLVQLPPRLAFDSRVSETFFEAMRRKYDGLIACEPRHSSWFVSTLDIFWMRYGITRVATDPARAAGGDQPSGAINWRYWRWHGSPKVYYSNYDDNRLKHLAIEVSRASNPRQTWCIFDNTAAGHAVKNALRLQQLCISLTSGFSKVGH